MTDDLNAKVRFSYLLYSSIDHYQYVWVFRRALPFVGRASTRVYSHFLQGGVIWSLGGSEWVVTHSSDTGIQVMGTRKEGVDCRTLCWQVDVCTFCGMLFVLSFILVLQVWILLLDDRIGHLLNGSRMTPYRERATHLLSTPDLLYNL